MIIQTTQSPSGRPKATAPTPPKQAPPTTGIVTYIGPYIPWDMKHDFYFIDRVLQCPTRPTHLDKWHGVTPLGHTEGSKQVQPVVNFKVAYPSHNGQVYYDCYSKQIP